METIINKDSFNFGFLDELKVGDVFRISPINLEPLSRFYTVLSKGDHIIRVQNTYGKNLKTIEMTTKTKYNTPNDTEVLIFFNRKRQIK
jgi:hypothetical protein